MSLPPPPAPRAETRFLGVALRLVLAAGFLWALVRLVAPFVELALWAVVTASALFPFWRWLEGRIGAWPASTVVTLAALAVVLGPIAVLADSAVRSAETLLARLHAGPILLPDLPAAVTDLPLLGAPISANWELARTNFHEFALRYVPRLIGFGEAAARPALHFAEGMAVFLAAVLVAGTLYVPGARLGLGLRRAAAALLDARGIRFVDIASGTIRSVARGVLGVAAIQGLVAGVGFVLFGVPGAGLLALAVLALAALQIGALPVNVPVALWAWMTQDTASAALLSVWLVLGVLLDLPLKSTLLGSGSGTPRPLVFAGVAMGAVSYGPVGLFVGPVALAILWDLLRDALAADRTGGAA